MVVDKETWEKFENFAISRLQFSSSTIDDRMRKLRYLERHGIDLMDFDEESVYTHFARRIRQGALPSTLNHAKLYFEANGKHPPENLGDLLGVLC